MVQNSQSTDGKSWKASLPLFSSSRQVSPTPSQGYSFLCPQRDILCVSKQRILSLLFPSLHTTLTDRHPATVIIRRLAVFNKSISGSWWQAQIPVASLLSVSGRLTSRCQRLRVFKWPLRTHAPWEQPLNSDWGFRWWINTAAPSPLGLGKSLRALCVPTRTDPSLYSVSF